MASYEAHQWWREKKMKYTGIKFEDYGKLKKNLKFKIYVGGNEHRNRHFRK